MMRAQQSFGAGLILTIGGVCKGCHHRPSCRPIIIITRNNSNTERRDPALKHLSLYLLQLLLCSLSLSLSIPSVARKQFFSLFFPIWKHQSRNWLASLSFFFFWLAGAPELRVLADREGGGGTQTQPKNIILLLFLTAFVIAENSQRVYVLLLFLSQERERERERRLQTTQESAR